MAWSVQALALTWLSFRLRLYELTLLSLALYGVLALWLLFVETEADLGDYTTVLNYRMLAFASGIASLYLAALVMWRWRPDVDVENAAAFLAGLLLAANFLTLWDPQRRGHRDGGRRRGRRRRGYGVLHEEPGPQPDVGGVR